MTRLPKYPIAAPDELAPEERKHATGETPAGLYEGSSFKFRHEVREPLENAETSYYRAYPHLRPRPMSSRRARRHAIRHG